MNRWLVSVFHGCLIAGILTLASCASKPVPLVFNPNADETRPDQYRSSLRIGFLTFQDARASVKMGSAQLIGWGSNTYYTDANIPAQVTKSFADSYKYLGFKTVWIKNPPQNFSFSGRGWVQTLRSLYPNIDIFVIGKIQNYEFLLREGGLSGVSTGDYTSLSVTTQTGVELYFLDSQTGKILWGNRIHHETFNRKISSKSPPDYAAIRLEEGLQNVILQSVDRSMVRINRRFPGAVQLVSSDMADLPKNPAGGLAGSLPAGKGRLNVVSSPPAALVYLDGVYYGTTPLSLDLAPGIHLLKVKKDGFATSRDKVGIIEGRTTPWKGVLPARN